MHGRASSCPSRLFPGSISARIGYDTCLYSSELFMYAAMGTLSTGHYATEENMCYYLLLNQMHDMAVCVWKTCNVFRPRPHVLTFVF